VKLRTPSPPPAAAAPPPELADRCWVADWVDPAEQLDDPQVTASGRWRRARDAWLADHDIPDGQHCQVIPCRRPRPAPNRP
jgi:hypothetical protein